MKMRLRGVVRGNTIELAQGSGLPDEQEVTIAIEAVAEPKPNQSPPNLDSWIYLHMFESIGPSSRGLFESVYTASCGRRYGSYPPSLPWRHFSPFRC